MEKDCPFSLIDNKPSWMNGRNELGAYCSYPKLLSMSPKCGPKINAGTHIILTGENLGNDVQDLEVKMIPIINSQVRIGHKEIILTGFF